MSMSKTVRMIVVTQTAVTQAAVVVTQALTEPGWEQAQIH